jgi:regulator of protease activity HflC (stomatin/prohibitin superfamily)
MYCAIFLTLAGAILCSFLLWAIPVYDVWVAARKGEAELKRAEFSKKVIVQEAEAKKASASLLAEAEIERAKGVAEANKIIGDSLKGHDEYLRYLWITQLEKSQHEVIYVPTEANIPIMEANRLKNHVKDITTK